MRPRRRRSRGVVGGRGTAVAAGALLLALLVPLQPPGTVRSSAAHAQTVTDGVGAAETDGAGAARIRLTVTHLTGVLGPGTRRPPEDDPDPSPPVVDLELRALVEHLGGAPIDGLRLVVEVHPPSPTRGLLRQAFNGEIRSDALHVHSRDVRDGEPLAGGDIAGVSESFDPTLMDWAQGPGGVHPVRIAVVRGTAVLAEAITAVVWLGEYPRDPLLTVTTWPLSSPPWRGSGGAYAKGIDRDIRTGGRLDVRMRALELVPDARVGLVVPAHLLEDLADRSDGFVVLERQDGGALEPRNVPAEDPEARLATETLRRIRQLAGDGVMAPLTGIYADADLPALLAGDTVLRELAAFAAVEGRRRVQLQLGREIEASTTILDGPVGLASLDLIPSETVVVPYVATDGPALGPDPALTEAVRPLRAPSGRLLTALITDPYLEEALAGGGADPGPVLAVQRPLAESAMAYFQAPGTAGRSLVVVPAASWAPTTSTAVGLLRAFGEAPWLHQTAPGVVASTARRSSTELQLAPSPTGGFDPAFASDLSSAARELTAVESALPEGIGRIGDRPVGELRDDLARSATRWERGPAAVEASYRVREVARSVEATFGAVDVVAGDVTLTSTSGQLPITLHRTEGEAITVVLEVQSQGRLLWPEGRRSEPLVLQAGDAQTVTFSTEAVSTGTFPVTVRVSDPNGVHVIATGRLSVRSTAISTNALLATGLVILVLLLVGILRRRDRGPRLSAVADPDPGGPATRPTGRVARSARDDSR